MIQPTHSRAVFGRVRATIVALSLAALAVAVLPSAAAATDFSVNSLTDEVDNSVGDAVCLTANAECTLRAAIGEANFAAGPDRINFDQSRGLFEGSVASSTITIASPLVITRRVTIDGGDCSAGADPKPCVAVKGIGVPFGPDAIVFNTGAGSPTGSAVRRLAIYNADRAVIVAPGITSVAVEGDWFGMDLDESVGASNDNQNFNGVYVAGAGQAGAGLPTILGADIGGSTPAERNVFRANSSSAVVLAGGDASEVAGNYFGTNSAGTPAAPGSVSGGGVQVYSVTGVGDGIAMQNTIGGAEAGVASDCDGPCNLFALSNSTPIIHLNPPSTVEPWQTSIKGNFIGLDLTGAEVNSSVGTGIAIGSDLDTTIGGAVADRNYIGGGTVGISVADGSRGLTVARNYIGVPPDGDGQVAPSSAGVVDDSGDSRPSTEIFSNLIAGDGTTGQDGLRLTGAEGEVTSNVLGKDAGGAARPFGGDAIEISGETFTIEANEIRGGRTAGIHIDGGDGDGDGNDVISNTLTANGTGLSTPAILIERQAQFNEIGSDDPLERNQISSNTGDAIELQGDGTDRNTLYRDTGQSNGGSFVDLNADGPGNPSTGPNNGIGAPTISRVTQTTAYGGALPGSTVRLFRNMFPGMAGNQDAFVGETTADGSGLWQITYPFIGEGIPHFATQTDTLDNTSERSAELLVDVTAPLAPSGLATTPGSPGGSSAPMVRGSAEAGSTVGVYTSSNCAGLPAVAGTAAQFASPGIAVNVSQNSTTPLSARAIDAGQNASPCSTSIEYVHDSTLVPVIPAPAAAPGPTGLRDAALKKCKKKKTAAAKKKCKTKAKKLPL